MQILVLYRTWTFGTGDRMISRILRVLVGCNWCSGGGSHKEGADDSRETHCSR